MLILKSDKTAQVVVEMKTAVGGYLVIYYDHVAIAAICPVDGEISFNRISAEDMYYLCQKGILINEDDNSVSNIDE